MLLCRIRPDDVYVWFMEMLVDAYDWVMVPNVYGMSQFADGGTFTTKPCLCGSNYILKMSDYTRGAWFEVWDALFWTFIGDHEEFFLHNARLSMMTNQLCKMRGAATVDKRRTAGPFLAGFNSSGADSGSKAQSGHTRGTRTIATAKMTRVSGPPTRR